MFDPSSYTIIASFFPRLLGLIYFFAFGAFLFQIKGLLGSKGILPISNFLSLVRENYPRSYFRLVPTAFWLNSSDAALMAVIVGGTALSVLLMLGIFPWLMLILLYILYLSIVSAGQDFLSFGWEGFLLEITINTFFLSLVSPPNPMVWISINLLLFRFHLQAGAVKLQSKDKNWRNLTAIGFHYQTQPLPNTIAWYIHKFPMWFHKLSTLLMFFVELILPFGIFGDEITRLCVFVGFFGLQFFIWATGNLSYLNHMTIAFSCILIGNTYLSTIFSIPSTGNENIALDIFCTLGGSILTLLQVIRLWQHFYPIATFQHWLSLLSPFHIACQYGIFAVMTTVRNEIIFEGSHDGKHWKEYDFFYKPSEIDRRPRRISPYQPRIDWQAWFLPLGYYRYDSWFKNFIYHLLVGTPDVLALIRKNPFKEAPPKYVRTVMYEYEFSSWKEKKEKGWWWRRKWVGIFTDPVTLKENVEEEEEEEIEL